MSSSRKQSTIVSSCHPRTPSPCVSGYCHVCYTAKREICSDWSPVQSLTIVAFLYLLASYEGVMFSIYVVSKKHYIKHSNYQFSQIWSMIVTSNSFLARLINPCALFLLICALGLVIHSHSQGPSHRRNGCKTNTFFWMSQTQNNSLCYHNFECSYSTGPSEQLSLE